uniref:Uncharacterized protein n=1 Tax=Arundo donax TaxID=35708 RepID=A0A0A9ASZ7_ARUDO
MHTGWQKRPMLVDRQTAEELRHNSVVVASGYDFLTGWPE